MESSRERYEATLARLVLLLTAVTAVVWVWQARYPYTFPFGASLSLAILVAACLFWRATRPRLAGLLLCSGLFAAIVTASWLSGGTIFWPFLCLPVAAAGLLFGPPLASTLGLASAAALWAMSGLGPTANAWAVLLLGLGVMLDLGLGPALKQLRLYSQRSLTAYDLVTQVRERQGELNRTVKALDVAYRLLEESNYQLAAARGEAEQWRDLKTRFATNLSHELRTPLNVILGFSELIYRSPRLYGLNDWPEPFMRDMVQVQRNAAYLSDLVNDIVDIAR
ncbi:MAG: ATP-binding protein, partial [Anaerolineae bacterium]